LPPTAYGDWLTAKAKDRAAFLMPYPAEHLTATMDTQM